MVDARKKGNRLTGEEREAAKKVVRELRDNSGMVWADIADEIGVSSAGTARKLYEEAGGNPHHLLEGKGGRTVEFTEGDWCDARCIGALPDSPCDCKCGGANHAGGGAKAQEILKDNLKEESSQEMVKHVEEIFEHNRNILRERQGQGDEQT